MENTNGTQAITFVKMQNASGRYAIFAVPGHRGRIYIDTKLFPEGKTPESFQAAGFVPAGSEVDMVTKEQERAAKAQAKAEKLAAAAAARQAKLQAQIDKANAAVAAAQARAAKAGVRATPATAAPEGVEQPNL